MKRNQWSQGLNRCCWLLTASAIIRLVSSFQSRITPTTSRQPSIRRKPVDFANQRHGGLMKFNNGAFVLPLQATPVDRSNNVIVDATTDVDADPKETRFLHNIRSKLTFPVNLPIPRRRSDPPRRRGRLISALRSIRRVVVFPVRWAKKRLRKDKEAEESSTESASIPTTIVVESERSQSTADALDALPESNAKESIIEASEAPIKAPKTKSITRANVKGDRWAVASVDLTGQWEILVTEDFKQQYDRYLTLLGQPMLVRSVAISIVGLTTEETIQRDNGRELFIRGRNVRGLWERNLVASGADDKNPEFEPILKRIVTADAEEVTSEAWWEDNGKVHRSWLRGVQKYGGGDFESKRYLDGDVLVCESTFHPVDENREKAYVTWRFKRQGK